MLIAVIGGKLHGVEALYLAGKAGFRTLLIDKNPDAIATRLCDQFLKFRFSLDQPIPVNCPPVDLILPDFFGADEALTSYQPKKRNWVAAMAVSLLNLADPKGSND